MSLDAILIRLLVGLAVLVLVEVACCVRHRRAARSRRPPVVCLGTRRDE